MPETLAALRQKIAVLEDGNAPARDSFFTLGLDPVDRHLDGGLARAAVHEVYAGDFGDLAAASGFAAALALRAGLDRTFVWIRHRLAGMETGRVDPHGLVHFGLDPDRVMVVAARDVAEGLRAGREALGCPALGAVIMELWGPSPALDLVATQRLMRAAGGSGVAGVVLRGHGPSVPSAATTRWRVRAAPSSPLPANAPGQPRFDLELERHRAGIRPGMWRVEWDRDTGTFRNGRDRETTVSGTVAPLSADRSAAAKRRSA